MTLDEWMALLRHYRAIAVIRSAQPEVAYKMAQTAIQAGMGLIEITWNCGNAAELIPFLLRTYPHCVIGTGTILDQADLDGAIAAGAQFVFSPHTDERLIRACQTHGIPMVPGALSPTEIVRAWAAGASGVKVFPIKTMGGVGYLQCLQGPLGHIPLIPTGGITLDNAATFLEAGAVAVGVSSQLFPLALLEQNAWSTMADRVAAFAQQMGACSVAHGRGS